MIWSESTRQNRLRNVYNQELKSYAATKREIMPGVEHRQRKDLNIWLARPELRSRAGI